MTNSNGELAVIATVNKELNSQLADPSAIRALVATTFKGFSDEKLVRQACFEAMMRGYTFQDILSKKIYAIPFGSGYSLVQSISDVRAIAMRSGQVGKKAPEYEETPEGKIISCSVTVLRRIDGYVGEYTATVYFDEYDKGKDNWTTKPRTMIAKVAEMHALRMAFPEELAQSYVEEEFAKPERFADLPKPPSIAAKDAAKEDNGTQAYEDKKNQPIDVPKPDDTVHVEHVDSFEQKVGFGDKAQTVKHDANCPFNTGGECTDPCIPTILTSAATEKVTKKFKSLK